MIPHRVYPGYLLLIFVIEIVLAWIVWFRVKRQMLEDELAELEIRHARELRQLEENKKIFEFMVKKGMVIPSILEHNLPKNEDPES